MLGSALQFSCCVAGLLLPVPFTLAFVLLVMAFRSSFGCLRWQLLPAFPTLLSASTQVWEASWCVIDLLVCSNPTTRPESGFVCPTTLARVFCSCFLGTQLSTSWHVPPCDTAPIHPLCVSCVV